MRGALPQLLMPGKILSVRTWHVLRHVLSGIHKIKPRHFPHHEKDVIDAHAGDLLDRLRELHRELMLLFLGPALSDIARYDWHLSSPIVLVSMTCRALFCTEAGKRSE